MQVCGTALTLPPMTLRSRAKKPKTVTASGWAALRSESTSVAWRLPTDEWYEAQQLRDIHGPNVAWDPLENPNAMLVMVQNRAKRLDYAKKEIVLARDYDVSPCTIEPESKQRELA